MPTKRREDDSGASAFDRVETKSLPTGLRSLLWGKLSAVLRRVDLAFQGLHMPKLQRSAASETFPDGKVITAETVIATPELWRIAPEAREDNWVVTTIGPRILAYRYRSGLNGDIIPIDELPSYCPRCVADDSNVAGDGDGQ